MDFEQLDQAEEDSLHALRLLQVEEKPFRRIAKRLLAAESIISTAPPSLPTPPPDSDPSTEADDAAVSASRRKEAIAKQMGDRDAWRSDLLLDFAALESSIARIQLLQTSNAEERDRYAAERERILEEAGSIRNSTVELRAQLGQARQVLEQRKAYDVLAERITSNRMLRPRDDQAAALAKLHGEIEALERESSEYKATWVERRVQFGKIVEEGKQMLRLIRDEKEEAERKEGMEGDDDGDAEGEDAASTKDGGVSAANTPRPDAGGSTPLHAGHEAENVSGARMVHGGKLAPGTRTGNSRAPTPVPQARSSTPARPEEPKADADMSGIKPADDDDDEDEGEVASNSAEEGEHFEEEEAPESMDVS